MVALLDDRLHAPDEVGLREHLVSDDRGERGDAGFASDEARDPPPGLPRLRVDIPLEPRHAWTVEPGIHFVAPLLARHRDRRDVIWDRVDELLGFGGVRIEQHVLVTEDGCEVLTAAIPL